MSILDRFKQRKETLPREVVRAVVKKSEKVRERNNEFHEAIADMLRRMDERNRRGQKHVEDN